MAYKMEIGSISHGTLKSDDLARAMLPYLKLAGVHPGFIGEVEMVADGECDDAEAESEIVNEAIDDLSEFVPENCYFGFHEGDGSDLGVWPLGDEG